MNLEKEVRKMSKNGVVDEQLIASLREIADELEEQNKLASRK